MTAQYVIIEIPEADAFGQDTDIIKRWALGFYGRRVRVGDVTELLTESGINEALRVEHNELQGRAFARGWETLADRAMERLS